MNLRKKKRGFLFLEVVLIGLTIGVIFYGRYQTVQRTEGKKVEQEKETSIERESRQAEQLPEQLPEPADTDFVKITDYIPDIVVDLKYATADNFTGTVIYDFKDAYLRYGTVKKLAVAQEKFKAMGYYIKIWDAYRPQSALDHFMTWKDTEDDKMKSIFYPKYSKSYLFENDFIIEKSAHTRGSTVDLTLVDEKTGKELDMGSYFDYFGDISSPLHNDGLTTIQIQNRMTLRHLMLDNGFIPLESEWWHYTLKDEPYPDTYFNVEVKSDGN